MKTYGATQYKYLSSVWDGSFLGKISNSVCVNLPVILTYGDLAEMRQDSEDRYKNLRIWLGFPPLVYRWGFW